MRDSEKIYEIVYGKTFGDYKLPDLEEFIHPFEVRFERNGISTDEIFEGNFPLLDLAQVSLRHKKNSEKSKLSKLKYRM